MSHVIRYFEKSDESYVGEVNCSHINLTQLQKIFGLKSDNPMYDSFLIEGPQMKILSRHLNINFNSNNYDYFLEFDSA